MISKPVFHRFFVAANHPSASATCGCFFVCLLSALEAADDDDVFLAPAVFSDCFSFLRETRRSLSSALSLSILVERSSDASLSFSS